MYVYCHSHGHCFLHLGASISVSAPGVLQLVVREGVSGLKHFSYPLIFVLFQNAKAMKLSVHIEVNTMHAGS